MTAAEIDVVPGSWERTPPHDLAAEQCVLGGMLMSKDAIADVIDIIGPLDHYRPAHQMVHEAILDLYSRGEPADAVTVADLMGKEGQILRIGGLAYLHTLLASVPTAANAGYYARIVREKAILRRLAEAGTRIAQFGYEGDGDADDLVDRAEAELYAVADRRAGEDYLPISEVLPGAMDEIEAISRNGAALSGVPTGFADLDALTNGLHPGQMIVVAARPAIGKTTVAMDFARSAAVHHGMTTVMFSLEMTRNEITMRLLSAETRVPLHAMRTGQMSEKDWARISLRMGQISEAPLYIDDSPNMSLMEIRAKCRRLKQRHGLRLVIVDYLQLMSSPHRRIENRQQEVSEISRSLKLLAKELDVPVIAVSQLNRGPEMRSDKRPLLSDLRESGSLEQDPDVVILLHREDAYDSESPRAGEADFIVAKHRNGPTAIVTVAFQGHYSRFVEHGSRMMTTTMTTGRRCAVNAPPAPQPGIQRERNPDRERNCTGRCEMTRRMTLGGHPHPCYCEQVCRPAELKYRRSKARKIAYGQWHPWADAAPVREAVAARVAEGVTPWALARRAGVDVATVHYLLYGCPAKGRKPPERIWAVTEAKLRASLGPMVTPVGARRRLQALAAAGHSLPRLAAHMRAGVSRLGKVANGAAEPGTILCGKIEAAFRELWDQPPPERTASERHSASKARAGAARKGWVPALAWEPDEIDDASAVPVPGWRRRNSHSSAEVAEDFAELAARHPDRVADPGKVRADAARRLGITRDALDTALIRAARAEREQAARVAEQEQAAVAA